jgi:hypothetical protein
MVQGKWNLKMLITTTSMQEKFQIQTEESQMGKEFQHIKYECIFHFYQFPFPFISLILHRIKIKK